MHPVHHLVIQVGQVVGVLQALDVVLGELRILEGVRVVDVDVRVVVVYYNDATTELLHILRGVAWVCLLVL